MVGGGLVVTFGFGCGVSGVDVGLCKLCLYFRLDI